MPFKFNLYYQKIKNLNKDYEKIKQNLIIIQGKSWRRVSQGNYQFYSWLAQYSLNCSTSLFQFRRKWGQKINGRNKHQKNNKAAKSSKTTLQLSIPTTNSCYYAIRIYNKSIMGKKLRTREVLTDTDQYQDDEKSQFPLSHGVGSSFLRKIIKSRLSIGRHTTVPKQNNFSRRISSCQITKILHPQLFQCPICLELMINPVMMNCGHAYCYRCLESNAAYSQKCCLCRSEQKGEPHIPLRIAEKLMEKFLLPYDSELIKYLCRSTDSLEWAKRRKISYWKQGLVVDFQDKCHVWRRGVIVNVLETELEIKINIKGIDLFEKVEATSRRLAPYTFFTRGRYLEDFASCLPEYDPTQRELNKLEYRPSWNEDVFFHFPEEHSAEVQVEEFHSNEDEALRIFHFQMNEISSILNCD